MLQVAPSYRSLLNGHDRAIIVALPTQQKRGVPEERKPSSSDPSLSQSGLRPSGGLQNGGNGGSDTIVQRDHPSCCGHVDMKMVHVG